MRFLWLVLLYVCFHSSHTKFSVSLCYIHSLYIYIAVDRQYTDQYRTNQFCYIQMFSYIMYQKRLCIIIDWWWKRDAAHKRARSLDRRDGNALGLCSDVTSWEWVFRCVRGAMGASRDIMLCVLFVYIYPFYPVQSVLQ